ncbi:MAG TPA: sulfur carrier protein ThiS [Bryobacteraceae bacterium]|nr:sulfur carrier protein ThiS [Bryobacteraceae bacterium]
MALDVTINGEMRHLNGSLSIRDLLASLGQDPAKVAVERNQEIVPRSEYEKVQVANGDKLEIVHFIGGGNAPVERVREDKPFVIAGKTYKSRLIIGTGKYKSYEDNARALEASGAEIVTVAVRRVNLTDRSKESLLDYIDREKMFILPNTAGCYTADDAIRTARLGREVGLSNWVKLEVIGDEQTLFPDNAGLVEATRVLSKEGFVVLPYTNDDLVNALRLIDAGAAAVMPLAAPIGSGLGIQNTTNLRILRERITQVPLIVDAGVGTASDAALAMELGADGVLMNTAIAAADDAEKMAVAMKLGVEAGRLAYEAGRMEKKQYATPSSPMAGRITA